MRHLSYSETGFGLFICDTDKIITYYRPILCGYTRCLGHLGTLDYPVFRVYYVVESNVRLRYRLRRERDPGWVLIFGILMGNVINLVV